jgi:hypothetical protein
VWSLALSGGCPPQPDDGESGDSSGPESDGSGRAVTGREIAPPVLGEVSTSQDGRSADVRWSAVPGATHYSLHFGQEEEPSLLLELNLLSYSVPNLAPCTEYHWRVVAHRGEEAAASPVQSFRTPCPSELPAPVSQPDPPNGAVDQPPTLSLAWQSAAPVNRFDVYFGSDGAPGLVGSTRVPRFERLPYMFSGEKYYWRVVAWNDKGATSSPVWSFSTSVDFDDPGASPPTAVDPVAPPDGAVNEYTLPELAWMPVPGADFYDVYLGESVPPVYFTRTQNSQVRIEEALKSGTTYYWQVVAVNRRGRTPGPTMFFTTQHDTDSGESGGGSGGSGAGGGGQRSDCVLTVSRIDLPIEAVKFARLSGDGRVAAFVSYDDDLVFNDTNDETDIFVYDRDTRVVERVSVGSDEQQADGSAWGAYVSFDGSQIAFATTKSLDPDDVNDSWDAYVRDRQSGRTEWASRFASGHCAVMGLSSDGRYVLYHYYPRGPRRIDVFVYDRQTGETEQANVADDGSILRARWWSVLSGDGRAVTMRVGNGDEGIDGAVYLRDLSADRTYLVSGEVPNPCPLHLSADGGVATFYDVQESPARVYVWERSSGTLSEAPLRDYGFQDRFVIPPWHFSTSADGSAFIYRVPSGGAQPLIRRYERLTGDVSDYVIQSDNLFGRIRWGPLISDTGATLYFEAEQWPPGSDERQSAWLADCE